MIDVDLERLIENIQDPYCLTDTMREAILYLLNREKEEREIISDLEEKIDKARADAMDIITKKAYKIADEQQQQQQRD